MSLNPTDPLPQMLLPSFGAALMPLQMLKLANCNGSMEENRSVLKKSQKRALFFKKKQPFIVSWLCGLTAVTQEDINMEFNPMTNYSKFCASAEVEPVVAANTIKCLCCSIIPLAILLSSMLLPPKLRFFLLLFSVNLLTIEKAAAPGWSSWQTKCLKKAFATFWKEHQLTFSCPKHFLRFGWKLAIDHNMSGVLLRVAAINRQAIRL